MISIINYVFLNIRYSFNQWVYAKVYIKLPYNRNVLIDISYHYKVFNSVIVTTTISGLAFTASMNDWFIIFWIKYVW